MKTVPIARRRKFFSSLLIVPALIVFPAIRTYSKSPAVMKTISTFIPIKSILILTAGMLAQIQSLPAEEDAATLLKAVQTKAMEARSLRVKCTLSMSKQNEDFARLSGEVCAKGANRWLFHFTGKIKGNDERFRGACDGDVLRMKGFKKGEEKAYLADRYNRQLRAWSATSFVPIFMSILYRDIDQGDDNLPAVSEAKFLGRQQLGATNAHVIEYLLTYPTQTKLRVKAWIDVDKLQPLKRESFFGLGIIEEVITSFELNPEITDSSFASPVTMLPSAQDRPTDTPTGPTSTPVQERTSGFTPGSGSKTGLDEFTRRIDTPKIHDSPIAAFQAMQAASSKGDWDIAAEQLTPESQAKLAGGIAVYLAVAAGMGPETAGDIRALFEQYGLDRDWPAGQADEAEIEKIADEHGREAAWAKMAEPFERKTRLIADAVGLLRSGGRWGESSYPFPDGKLADLKIEGDSATALIIPAGGDLEKGEAIGFRRIAGSWLVEPVSINLWLQRSKSR